MSANEVLMDGHGFRPSWCCGFSPLAGAAAGL